ncbi:MAG: hypothetical protein K0S82_1781 [Gaiellaceae bacterium]|nr:hypothetical protein [Gaiellaceae bacterium]
MLTAYQAETIAFVGEGEIVCYDCVEKETGELGLEQADRGLHHTYSPLCRYSIDEHNGERTYEEAEERLNDWVADHPELALVLGVAEAEIVPAIDPTRREAFVVQSTGKHRFRIIEVRGQFGSRTYGRNRHRAVDNLAERLGDTFAETCGSCGKSIT